MVADPNANMSARFAIPSRCAGVLIGQGGGNIKQIHEKSGARLQLHARSEIDSTVVGDMLKERIVTASGTKSACIKAIKLSLDLLVEEVIAVNSQDFASYAATTN